MLDYAITFDQWWYFHHRLSEGALAQWNPFSLLGMIAVQWNCIPLSPLFSPFLVLSELNLETFHALSVIGTFLSISVLYSIGRLFGYDRFLALIPVIGIITSGYRYWASRSMYANYLLFYPLAIVCLLYALKAEGRKAFGAWLAFVMILSFAFMSARLENMVYSYTFILLIFLVLGAEQIGNWKKMGNIVLPGIAAIIATLALTAWQMPFLIDSMIENSRVSYGIDFKKLIDTAFLKWTLISVVHQPAFLLMCFNIILLKIFSYKRVTGFETYRFSSRIFLFAIVGILNLFILKFIQTGIGWLHIRPFFSSNTHPVYQNLDIVFSWSGAVALLCVTGMYLLTEKSLTLRKTFSFFAAVFAGFYIAEYSWHIWPININTHFFFMMPLFASFITCGAVRLMMRKKTWILTVLVLYHFIGETGLFMVYEVLGIPWLAPRAALAEIPFQIILILESLLFLTEGGNRILSRVFSTRYRVLFGKEYSLFSILPVAVKIACVIGAFLTIKMLLMPAGLKAVSPAGTSHEQVYWEEFPFAETPVNNIFNARINLTALEAKKNAERIRRLENDPNLLQRVRVEDSILNWSPVMFYKFMPAYSQKLNTAPVYSSEIPKTMKAIFRSDPAQKKNDLFRRPHPEMNLIFINYKYSEALRKGKEENIFDYIDEVNIFPHKGDNAVYREIMAEEGSHTPRAFVTPNVERLESQRAEYEYLHKVITKGGLLTDQITTSDPQFFKNNAEYNAIPLTYQLNVVKDAPEHIVLNVNTNQTGYLALLDTWSKGWSAYVDGVETRIYRGYIGARFIELARGDHHVEFRYRVPGLVAGAVISSIGWLLIAGCIIVVTHRKLFLFFSHAVLKNGYKS